MSDEHTWERLDDGRTRCRVHGETFSPSTFIQVADVPWPTFVHGGCGGCWRDRQCQSGNGESGPAGEKL